MTTTSPKISEQPKPKQRRRARGSGGCYKKHVAGCPKPVTSEPPGKMGMVLPATTTSAPFRRLSLLQNW